MPEGVAYRGAAGKADRPWDYYTGMANKTSADVYLVHGHLVCGASCTPDGRRKPCRESLELDVVCRHVLAVNGGGQLVHRDGAPPQPMASQISAFDEDKLNFRYWPAYQRGELDEELLPVRPGSLTRCMLTYRHAAAPTERQRRLWPLCGGGNDDPVAVGDAVGGGGGSGDDGGGGGGDDNGGSGGVDDEGGGDYDGDPHFDDGGAGGAGAESDRAVLVAIARRLRNAACDALVDIVGAPAAFAEVSAHAKRFAEIACGAPDAADMAREWVGGFVNVDVPDAGATYSSWKRAIEEACVVHLAALAAVKTSDGFQQAAQTLCGELMRLHTRAAAISPPQSRAQVQHSKNVGRLFPR